MENPLFRNSRQQGGGGGGILQWNVTDGCSIPVLLVQADIIIMLYQRFKNVLINWLWKATVFH